MTTCRSTHQRDWTQQIRILRAELDFLLAASNRSDPVEETVLSLFESTVRAATAASRLRWASGGAEARAAMHEMLAAARAAVVAASFALAQNVGDDGDSPPSVNHPRAVASR